MSPLLASCPLINVLIIEAALTNILSRAHICKVGWVLGLLDTPDVNDKFRTDLPSHRISQHDKQ
jgi:hypothetical protein